MSFLLRQAVGLLQMILFFHGAGVLTARYGLIYLLAYIPIAFIFGFFLGIPQIIGIIRVSNTFTITSLILNIIPNAIWIALFALLIKGLGINQVLPVVVAIGALTGIGMSSSSLREEIAQSNKS